MERWYRNETYIPVSRYADCVPMLAEILNIFFHFRIVIFASSIQEDLEVTKWSFAHIFGVSYFESLAWG